MFRGLSAGCRSIVVVALTALAGCGHAGSSLSPVATGVAGPFTGAASPGVATAKLSLSIPNPAALSSTERQVAYVSSASATVNITATYGAQTIPNNGLNVASGSPYCVASGTGRLCQLPIKAPIGSSVQFTMQILDANADILSTSNFATPVTAAIAEGGANVLPTVVLDAVPASFSVSVGEVPYVQVSTSSTPQVIVTAKDAAGDIIAGPGNYRTSNGLTAITYSIAQYAATSLTTVAFSANANCSSSTSTATWSAPSNTLYFCNSGSPDLGTQLVVTESDNSVAETIPVPFAAIPRSETQLSVNDYVESPVYFVGTITYITSQYHTGKVGGLGYSSPSYAFATDANGSQGVGCTLSGGQLPSGFVVYGANGNFYEVAGSSTPSVYEFSEASMTTGGGGACSGTQSAAALTNSPSAPMVEDPVNQRLWIAVGSSIEVLSELGSLPVVTTLSSSIGNINALAYSAPENAMYASNYGNSKVERFSTSTYAASTVTLDGGSGGGIVTAGPDGAVYALTLTSSTTNLYRLNPGYVFSASPPLVAQYNVALPNPPEPEYIAVGGDGQVYYAEGLTENIDRIDPVSGNIDTSAAPNTGSLGSIATASGNGINRLLWLNGDYNVYAWPGIWPAQN